MVEDLQRVVLLALDIFVVEQAVGIAGAGNVDAGAGIAMAGEEQMHLLVAGARAVAAAIRYVFED